jgi:hypothetical protein
MFEHPDIRSGITPVFPQTGHPFEGRRPPNPDQGARTFRRIQVTVEESREQDRAILRLEHFKRHSLADLLSVTLSL